MRSKTASVLLRAGTAVALLALVADVLALALLHDVNGWLVALTTIALGTVGAGVARGFTDDVEHTPDLQEIISRARQQIS